MLEPGTMRTSAAGMTEAEVGRSRVQTRGLAKIRRARPGRVARITDLDVVEQVPRTRRVEPDPNPILGRWT